MNAKRSALAVAVVVCAVSSLGARQAADGCTPLFNGRDLTGWKVPGTTGIGVWLAA